MSVTPATRAQVEKTIAHEIEETDAIAEDMGKRDEYLRNWPAAKYCVYSSVAQLLRMKPQDVDRILRAALRDTGDVFASQGHKTARYGAGRQCANMDDAFFLVLAQNTLEPMRKKIDESRLMPRRDEARDKLLYQNLFEFAAVAKLVAPVDLDLMINRVNGAVAGVIHSGWLDRNVVKIR